MAISAQMRSDVSALYAALFGRAPEKSGLEFWLGQLDSGVSMTQVAQTMYDTEPARAYYPTDMSNADVVASFYQNVLGRPGDTEGLKFWEARLVTLGNKGALIAEMVANVQAYNGTDADGLKSKALFDNKVAVGVTYGYTLGNDDVALATAVMKLVTATDKTAAIDLATNGPSTALTTAADKITGTAAAEQFKAVASSLVAEGTLQVTDTIDGGDGSDTLSVAMSQGFTGFTTGSVKNVETVKLTNTTVAAVNFDATGVTGATKYVLDSTKGVVNLSDLGSLAAIEVSGPTGTNTFTAAYDAVSTVATGTQTDTQSLKVTDVGTIDSDGVVATTNAKYLTVNIAKVEALALETAGTANSLNLSGVTDAKAITVKGAGQTEISAVGTAVTSFDASAATGNVIVNLTAAADGALTTVKTGAGNDTVTIALGDLTATATVDGGAGTDTLNLVGAAGTIQPTFTGFEAVGIAGVTSTLTFSGTNASGIAAINVSGTNSAASSFVNMGANALTVTTVGAQAQAFSADNKAAVTYNANSTATATSAETVSNVVTFDGATALTVNVGTNVTMTGAINAAAAKDLTINVASKTLNSVEQSSMTSVVTAAEATSFTVKADGQLNGANLVAAKATTGTLTTGSTANAVFDIDAAKLNTLNVTAGKGLALTGSTLTGLQNLTVATAGAFTAVALDDAAAVTVSGTGTTSSATFTTLGKAGLTHNVNVTASGLKAGLTTTDINAGSASVGIDASAVTGNVSFGAINGDSGVSLNAKSVGGTLNAGNVTTTKGSIAVDVSNAVKAVTLGTLTTDGVTGDVSVLAGNALSTVTVGAITGKNVTVNATGALGAVLINNGAGGATDITAATSVTYAGTNLTNNGVDIATTAASTDFTASLTGGAKNEVITIAGGAAQKSITVSGDLGAGTNSVAVTLANNAAATAAQTVNLSGLTGSDKATTTTSTNLSAENNSAITYTGSAMNDSIKFAASATGADFTKAISITDTTLTDTDTLTLGGTGAGAIALTNLSISGIEAIVVDDSAATVSINASAISGKTIALSGQAANDILSLTGTEAADVVSLANLTSGATAAVLNITLGAGNDTLVGSLLADTITGGAGADTLTGGAGADTFVYATGAGSALGAAGGTFTGYDTITDFTTTSDKIKFLASATVDTSGGAQTAADNTAYVFANNQSVGGAAVTTLAAADFANVDKVVTYINAVASNTAGAGMDFIVAVNDATAGKAAIYHVINVAGDPVVAAEVELLGVTTGVVAAADFIV